MREEITLPTEDLPPSCNRLEEHVVAGLMSRVAGSHHNHKELSGSRVRKQAESLTGEVVIQCEGVGQPVAAHQLEARAIDQRKPSTAGGKQCGYRGCMQSLVDPKRAKHRDEDVSQCPHRFQSEASLDKCERLDEDVVGSDERPPLGNHPMPCVDHVGVPGLVRVEDREDRRGVDE